jgi:putative transposase
MENMTPLVPNKVYHLFTHAVDKTNLFFQERNYFYMLDLWKKHAAGKFNTYAYCFMPNHIHLCVKTLEFDLERKSSNSKGKTPHSKVMNNFLSAYVLAVNRQEKRKGTLLRGRFGRKEVDNEAYFRDLICYIHHNAIHHFDLATYDAWRHTSYHDFFKTNDSFLMKETVYNRFKPVNGFEAYHQHYKNVKQYVSYEEDVQKMFERLRQS